MVAKLFRVAIYSSFTNRVWTTCRHTYCTALTKVLPFALKPAGDLKSGDYDGIVYVSSDPPGTADIEPFKSVLQSAAKLDSALSTEGGVFAVNLPATRFVYSPTGPITTDYDDVRSFSDAAHKGIKRALKAGITSPLLVLPPVTEKFPRCNLVTLLGALEALYVPIQSREDIPERSTKIKHLGVYDSALKGKELDSFLKLATALETGRAVARDIGGGDPERMAPPRVEEYVREVFQKTDIGIEVVHDRATLEKEYPLFAAVDRAATVIERHRGRVIYLTYEPSEGPVDLNLYLVGKGVTYDTGGADIKAGGVMQGMSRDKCGSAAVAGFMKVLSILKPRGVRVTGVMCMVRNSVGENCYVSDELITARSKARVRVGNTDAEGRMAMADALCKMKEVAVAQKAVNAHLFTIATLTGHAAIAVGNYTAIVDNGPARISDHGRRLQRSGEPLGDMFEISSLRRDDIQFHRGKCDGDDVYQCNNLPSTRTARGHQGPAAFLLLTSGLDKHGSESAVPLRYTHLDIAGSAGDMPDNPTGAPIIGLTQAFLQGRFD